MINNLQKFIKNLEVSKSNVGMHVYFDPDNGKIIKICNQEEETPGYHSIYVNYDDVKDIQKGLRRLDDFIVTFNPIENRLEVTDQIEKIKIPNVRDRLYNIPQNVPDADLTISNYKDEWYIYLDQDKRLEQLELESKFVFDLVMNFSITDKNDPNVLHNTIKIGYQSLLYEEKVNVTDQVDGNINPTDVSIYTAKYFDKYNFEVRQ